MPIVQTEQTPQFHVVRTIIFLNPDCDGGSDD
jgi:hypothetical protein